MRTTLALTYLLGDVLQCTSRLSEKASNISLFGCDDKSHCAKFAIIKIKISPSLRAVWNIQSYSMNTRREKTETQQNGLWPSALNDNKNRWYWKKKLTHTIVSYTPPMTIASFHERLSFVRRLWNDEGSGHKVTSLCVSERHSLWPAG